MLGLQSRNGLALFALFCLAAICAAAQSQVASLHPTGALVWQRTSPSEQHSEGPVLY